MTSEPDEAYVGRVADRMAADLWGDLEYQALRAAGNRDAELAANSMQPFAAYRAADAEPFRGAATHRAVELAIALVKDREAQMRWGG